jgi:hypothetical protein
MGSFWGWDSRDEMVLHLLEEGESRIIASSLEMTGFREPVLWLVRERDGERWIECCCLIMTDDKQHGYKRIHEADGPFATNCPLEFLEMAPSCCEEWRQSVRAHHKLLGRKPVAELPEEGQ